MPKIAKKREIATLLTFATKQCKIWLKIHPKKCGNYNKSNLRQKSVKDPNSAKNYQKRKIHQFLIKKYLNMNVINFYKVDKPREGGSNKVVKVILVNFGNM